MRWLESFILSGRAVELIMALIVLETIALLVWRSRSSALPFKPTLLGNLLAGFFLMFAVRAALGDWHWGWIAGSLTVAFAGHLTDLAGRLREAGMTRKRG